MRWTHLHCNNKHSQPEKVLLVWRDFRETRLLHCEWRVLRNFFALASSMELDTMLCIWKLYVCMKSINNFVFVYHLYTFSAIFKPTGQHSYQSVTYLLWHSDYLNISAICYGTLWYFHLIQSPNNSQVCCKHFVVPYAKKNWWTRARVKKKEYHQRCQLHV